MRQMTSSGDGSETGIGSERGSWRLASRYSWVQCTTSMLVVLFEYVTRIVAIVSAIASIALTSADSILDGGATTTNYDSCYSMSWCAR